MNETNNINLDPKESSARVDRAWNKLKTRIEQNGIYANIGREIIQRPRFNFATVGIAASFLVLLTLSILIFKGVYSVKGERIILENIEANSTLVTMLEDGSTVYLAQNTSLSKPKFFGKLRRETKLNGDAFFDISRNVGRPFVIETQLAKIEVLGTSFSVNENIISVKSGKVRVWLKNGGASSTLLAGETLLVESDRLKPIVFKNSDSLFTSYTKRMHFKDEQLINVIQIINKNNASHKLQISLEQGLENRLITATFNKEEFESYAKLICIALDLRYEINNKAIRIYR